MNNDFGPNSHKNLELFRYYLNRDLQEIDNSIQDNRGELFGYFIASLIDILIVTLFDDSLKSITIICKICVIVALVILFILVSAVINKLLRWKQTRFKESGRKEYIVEEERQKIIDKFDNIACDGLLICESYMRRYEAEANVCIREFYLFEIIHYLIKSTDLFEEIYDKLELYVSSEQRELIDVYRINNYITFAEQINKFLQNETKEYRNELGIQKDIENLDEKIKKWRHVNKE